MGCADGACGEMGFTPAKMGMTMGPDEGYEISKSTSKFTVKDSGKRAEFSGGMVRDVNENKSRPDLVRDGPMFLRWVRQVTLGAIKYKPRNWMKAEGEEELKRFLESASRHFEIWFTWRMFGINIEDQDNPTTEPLTEDHAAAVFFNINGVEYVLEKMNGTQSS